MLLCRHDFSEINIFVMRLMVYNHDGKQHVEQNPQTGSEQQLRQRQDHFDFFKILFTYVSILTQFSTYRMPVVRKSRNPRLS